MYCAKPREQGKKAAFRDCGVKGNKLPHVVAAEHDTRVTGETVAELSPKTLQILRMDSGASQPFISTDKRLFGNFRTPEGSDKS